MDLMQRELTKLAAAAVIVNEMAAASATQKTASMDKEAISRGAYIRALFNRVVNGSMDRKMSTNMVRSARNLLHLSPEAPVFSRSIKDMGAPLTSSEALLNKILRAPQVSRLPEWSPSNAPARRDMASMLQELAPIWTITRHTSVGPSFRNR